MSNSTVSWNEDYSKEWSDISLYSMVNQQNRRVLIGVYCSSSIEITAWYWAILIDSLINQETKECYLQRNSTISSNEV